MSIKDDEYDRMIRHACRMAGEKGRPIRVRGNCGDSPETSPFPLKDVWQRQIDADTALPKGESGMRLGPKDFATTDPGPTGYEITPKEG